MSIVVLGSNGQVATELRARAPEARVLPRTAADLAQPDAAAAALAAAISETDARCVINAAAYTAVDKAESEEEIASLVNGAAPAALAREAARAGVPFVHVSTDYVFPGDGDRPWRPDDATGPLGAYGRSKLAGEEGVRSAGGAHAILRTSWVFSAHGGNFVKTMLRLSETRDALSIVSDQVGGPTPAGAIADACLRIASRLAESPELSGTYHFSGAPDVSWADFAREIFRLAGRDVAVTDIPTVDYPTPAARPLNSRLHCAATEAAFGLPRPDWRAALSGVLADLGATKGT